MRASYGVSFVSLNSDLCAASVTEVLYSLSYNIGPRYNGVEYIILCQYN